MFPVMPQAEPPAQVATSVIGRTRKEILADTASRMKSFKSFSHVSNIIMRLDDKEWGDRTVSLDDLPAQELAESGEVEISIYDRNADPDEDPNLAPEYWARLGCQRGESPVDIYGAVKPQVASMDLRYTFELGKSLPLSETADE